MNGHLLKAKYQVAEGDEKDEKNRLISEAQAKAVVEHVTGKKLLFLKRPPNPNTLNRLYR
ncbi:hypothetical protein [Escherichia coli]|uniref:hypothetical protein n=1 Tax=Escherichia coli TaxID=562 RepID=UPI00388F07E4